jgi:hypothetical protein
MCNNYLLIIYSNTPLIYLKLLKDELNSLFLIKQLQIKEKLKKQIKTNGSFFLTLNVKTAINQNAYFGITM